jgi:hypothetical protein
MGRYYVINGKASPFARNFFVFLQSRVTKPPPVNHSQYAKKPEEFLISIMNKNATFEFNNSYKTEFSGK